MVIQLNFKSGKPVYLQITDQIKSAAASGVLQPGEALPSIRPLAEELRINRNTVAKAYAELESQGIDRSVAGKGCFLAAEPFAIQENGCAGQDAWRTTWMRLDCAGASFAGG